MNNANKDMGSNNNNGQINVKGGVNTNASNINNAICSGKKLVSKQKIALDKINNQYIGVIDKNQHLDITKHSLES
jgi:hypothetical protein